jgi:hypothetical protein
VLHLPTSTSMLVGFVTGGVGIFASLSAGMYSDRFPRSRLLVVPQFLSILAVLPMFAWVLHAGTGSVFLGMVTIASRLSLRLPGYTGSHPRDLRRALADPKRSLRLFVSLDELDELITYSIASYHGTPHGGLNGATPLEAMEFFIRGEGNCWPGCPKCADVRYA